MQSIFDLIRFDNRNLSLLLKYAIEQGTINQIEYALVVIQAISEDSPAILLPFKKELLSILKHKHFNILATLQEILDPIKEIYPDFLSPDELKLVKSLNTPSPIIVNTILTAVKGQKFLFSKRQVDLALELQRNETDDVSFLDNLYGGLVAIGLGAMTLENENSVHRKYNINSNFDEIEINSQYDDEVNRIINEIYHTKIKSNYFEKDFIDRVRPKFRVFDPGNLLFRPQSKPPYVNWIPSTTSETDFTEVNDIEQLMREFVNREDEYVTLLEFGNQWPDGGNYTCYFEIFAFIAKDLKALNALNQKQYTPGLIRQNLLISELPLGLKSSLFPVNGVQPIFEISYSKFRGQSENAIGVYSFDSARDFGVEQKTLKEILNTEHDLPISAIKWQSEIATDRRRYKPRASGFTIRIKKTILSDYLTRTGSLLCYDVFLRRSTTMHHPEDYMEWYEYSKKIKVSI